MVSCLSGRDFAPDFFIVKFKFVTLILTSFVSWSASAGLLEAFDNMAYEFDAGIRSTCANFVAQIRNSWAQKELANAVREGRAKEITKLSHFRNPGEALHREIDGLVMGASFDRNYCNKMLQQEDVLYAYDGVFFRYRPSNDTIFVIKEVFEGQMEHIGLLSKRLIMEIHATFPEKNLFPAHPELAKFKEEFSGIYSDWKETSNGLKYSVQLEASWLWVKCGYMNLTILFRKDGKIEMSFAPREHHPVDHIYKIQSDDMLRDIRETAIGPIVETWFSKKPLVLNNEAELIAIFEMLKHFKSDLRFQY